MKNYAGKKHGKGQSSPIYTDTFMKNGRSADPLPFDANKKFEGEAPLMTFAGDGGASKAQRKATEEASMPQTGAKETAKGLEHLDEKHRNPLLNSNTSEQNLILLIEEWEANDPTQDDRKLAHILATTMHETGETFHSVNEVMNKNYFPSRYAPTGYWGRGFVQLTHESNYKSMGEKTGVDLENNPQAAILPTLSSYVTANGMMHQGYNKYSLNNFLPISTNEAGERVEGEADWFNARNVVNPIGKSGGKFHDAAGKISTTAQEIYKEISAYRAAKQACSIENRTTLADYLVQETDHFQAYRDSDALRITEALGYGEFKAPNMSSGTDMQKQYGKEVKETGYATSISSLNKSKREAIKAFQVNFNQNHHLEVPLPEDGRLDDRTYRMIMLKGNRIASGESMIESAFDGKVEALNLYEGAYQNYQRGCLSLNGLALEIYSYLPAHDAQAVLNIFEDLGSDKIAFANALAHAGHTHDRLALINPEILCHMLELLGPSKDAIHELQANRVHAAIRYQPIKVEGEYTSHYVAKGETLGTIAAQYGMGTKELGELNGIPAPYSAIKIGQKLKVKNPKYNPNASVPQAPSKASTLDPLVDND